MDPLTRRATGVYYTPRDASTWMAQWLLDGRTRTVLEPSSGDGSFVRAIAEVAGSREMETVTHAVEIDPTALAAFDTDDRVRTINADFHAVEPFPVDAAVGNPPFVRFRHLDEGAARVALDAGAEALGGQAVEPSGSTWMTVVLHAATFLRPGGRLAFVLPADALYVRYGRPFWAFMAGRFGQLRVIRCRERIFPDVLQDVLLLLADRSGSSTTVIESELYPTVDDLTASRVPEKVTVAVEDVVGGEKPFAKALLGQRHARALRAFEGRTVRADTYVKFNIGYVAGDKTFFHPTPEIREEYDLPERSLFPAAKSGRQMTGSGLRSSSLGDRAVGCLWLPDPARLTVGERTYIAVGEGAGIHTRYKTRIRKPWFRVPGVKVPDLLLPVFGELPKIMLNDAGLVTSNSLVAGFWQAPMEPGGFGPGGSGAERFALAWYSSVTRLGIELSVHSLGGGVLVVIPGEADAIRMPVLPDGPAPQELVAQLEAALSAADLIEAYRVGDAYLASVGWGREDLEAARRMADLLLGWRVDR